MIGHLLTIFIFFSPSFSHDCIKKFDTHAGRIILTRVSERNGASFIRKIYSDSLEDCMNDCCSTTNCTVGVYGPKKGASCFLFNCREPNVCNFTMRSNYDVFVYRPSIKPLLGVHKIEKLAFGTLQGQCGPRNPCVDSNTICDSGQCECQTGFINKNHACVRSLCKKPELQFQCDDGTACIAIYDVCNGIRECSDGSDETACSTGLSYLYILIYLIETSFKDALKLENPTEMSQPFPIFETNIPTQTEKSFLPENFIYEPGEDSIISDLGFESLKHRPVRPFHLEKDLPISRSYDYRRSYYTPQNRKNIEAEPDSLIFREPPQQSMFNRNAFSPIFERPSQFRSSVRFHESPQYRDDDRHYYDDDVNREHRDLLNGARYRPGSYYASPQDTDDDKQINTHKKERDTYRRRSLRVLKRPVSGSNDEMYEGWRKNEHKKDEDERPPKAVIGPLSQSGYQWHTATIVLAIGLGMTSCLLGFLVGCCRQRGKFENEGPRSKVVAASHLRRRILRTRGLSNNDLEKNSLLSRLHL